MLTPKHYSVCEICGASGHKGKGCPLYRLNEKQTALAGLIRTAQQAKSN